MTNKRSSEKAKQLSLSGVSGWGGARRGAGRPNRTGLVSHMKRPSVSRRHPLHITLRLKPKIMSLRQKKILNEFKAGIRLAHRQGLTVLHYSLQSNHLHFIAEAKSNSSLAAGMRSLAGRFSRRIRAAFGLKTGGLFAGRYHLHVLKTPTEMKRALQCVLLNFARHAKGVEHLDPFSSAHTFLYWRDLIGTKLQGLIGAEVRTLNQMADLGQLEPPLFSANSWLVRRGWQRAPSAG